MEEPSVGLIAQFWKPVYNDLRELWQRIPFNQRIFTITITAFLIEFICFAILMTDEVKTYKTLQRRESYSRAVKQLSYTFIALSNEEVLTIAYIQNKTNENMAAVLKAQKNTDAKLESFFKIVTEKWPEIDLDESIELDQGTFTTETGLRTVSFIRSQLTPGGAQLALQGVRNNFILTSKILLSLIAKVVASLCTDTNVVQDMRLQYAGVMSYHLTEAHRSARRYFNSSVPSNSGEALKQYTRNMNTYQMVKEYFLLPILTAKQSVLLPLGIEVATLKILTADLQSEANFKSSFTVPATFETDPLDVIPTAMVFLKSLTDDLSLSNEAESGKVVRYAVMLAVAVLTLIACIAQLVYFEVAHAEKNAVRVRNAHVMHDVLARVGEIVRCFGDFTLDALPPPKSMLGTRVGILELRLQQCLASVKVLAPSLHPLLFPKRLAALAAKFSVVSDPSSMVFTRKIRDNLLKEPLHLIVDGQTQEENAYAKTMYQITRLHVKNVSAAFVFVDLQVFHKMSSPEMLQFSEDHFQSVVTAIEECIYQFSGVMQSATMDKVIGVWNVAEPTKNYFELAATCGLVLASRLSAMRSKSKAVHDNLPIRIGVVAGDVQVGVFGNAEKKVMQLFGPPMLTGITVARANGFHATTVACDESIRRQVERVYPCKPIELMDNGGCIYEVIHEQFRKEVDLETKLSVYCKAFELFQKKYYREALRAFRAYTKLYGYDSSVERIQTIITGV